MGNFTWLILLRRAVWPVARMLARINVESTPAKWKEDFDQVVHISKILHDASDFSTVHHGISFKRVVGEH